jgi:hypothetical protein
VSARYSDRLIGCPGPGSAPVIGCTRKERAKLRRIVVSEFVSLDGVMEDPGGAEGFAHGGWSMPYWHEDIGKLKFEELLASDALLLGRVAYQGFAAAWPDR